MKYLVDTCVLSELAKKQPDPKVINWLKGHAAGNMFFVSVITIGEILEGIESLPGGDRRKQKLLKWFESSILEPYKDSIVDFDKASAMEWGVIKGRCNRIGKSRPDLDSQIAATAVAHDMTVVTRNVADMAHTGASVVNPFE